MAKRPSLVKMAKDFIDLRKLLGEKLKEEFTSKLLGLLPNKVSQKSKARRRTIIEKIIQDAMHIAEIETIENEVYSLYSGYIDYLNSEKLDDALWEFLYEKEWHKENIVKYIGELSLEIMKTSKKRKTAMSYDDIEEYIQKVVQDNIINRFREFYHSAAGVMNTFYVEAIMESMWHILYKLFGENANKIDVFEANPDPNYGLSVEVRIPCVGPVCVNVAPIPSYKSYSIEYEDGEYIAYAKIEDIRAQDGCITAFINYSPWFPTTYYIGNAIAYTIYALYHDYEDSDLAEEEECLD